MRVRRCTTDTHRGTKNADSMLLFASTHLVDEDLSCYSESGSSWDLAVQESVEVVSSRAVDEQTK